MAGPDHVATQIEQVVDRRMRFTPNLDEDLIDVERVAEALVLSPQPPGEFRPELDAPKTNRLVADRNTPFGQQVFDISVAQIESMKQPDRVADDVGWKPVALLHVHARIVG